MKILTLNFLTCAVKACKSQSTSFPLHPKECTLVSNDLPLNMALILNILPRIDWVALCGIANELSLPTLPASPPTPEELQQNEQMLQDLHTLLLETEIEEGSLVCGCCGHEYRVKEGIGNFLLPGHLV